jgi:hypothetical protein
MPVQNQVGGTIYQISTQHTMERSLRFWLVDREIEAFTKGLYKNPMWDFNLVTHAWEGIELTDFIQVIFLYICEAT